MEQTENDKMLNSLLNGGIQQESAKPTEEEIEEKQEQPAEQEQAQQETAPAQEQEAAGDGKDQEEGRVQYNYEMPSETGDARDFIKSAEAIPEEKLGSLAKQRRNMAMAAARRYDVTVDDLLWAEAESLEQFVYNGRKVTMLKMRLRDSGLPVYVSQNVAGTNFRHMETFIGHSYTVAVNSFINVNEGEVDPKYIVLASIQQAEFAVKGVVYGELNSSNEERAEKARREPHEGVVTGLIRINPRFTNDRPMPEIQRWIVFFEYQGVQFSMPARNFNYLSSVKSISEQISIGEHFVFRFTSATKKDYQKDNRAVKEMMSNGDNLRAPKGTYYEVNATALDFRRNPATDLRTKLNSGTVFLAHVTQYNSVRGLIVEVAPGWEIKAFLDNRFANVKLGDRDVAAHTPVTVKLNRLDFNHRVGQCQVIAFPQGTKGSMLY